ncbi:hypothetical protein PPL_10860 [Heterostelium album PN500]|uniref:Uncharacterized protein n=1 Tax=Heterostelium pallidum (strain ATCC 26659 / Pp 5 / PN500) TaxID=670386 RepID=D3BS68_HETP5|nr:hypothetical protein PPL_10860 [Heterostelium album PN500]EFA75805.1 hypothetical protein PPL_10860 [Heterostelium album PN500]|eukprot:XP_020427939.1 hypothetical protein PPL_10860 [Heterostelium album PN500]
MVMHVIVFGMSSICLMLDIVNPGLNDIDLILGGHSSLPLHKFKVLSEGVLSLLTFPMNPPKSKHSNIGRFNSSFLSLYPVNCSDRFSS